MGATFRKNTEAIPSGFLKLIVRGAICIHRGNAEGAKLRLIFTDEVASEREWPKRTLFQIPHQRPEIIGKVGLKHLDADLVDARGATVALDSLEAGQHQPVGDTSR